MNFFYANRDTVLKFSVVSCAFCFFFFSLIWAELISQMHIYLIILNLNLYDNHDCDHRGKHVKIVYLWYKYNSANQKPYLCSETAKMFQSVA